MRVLLAAPSATARLHTLVPLAWALRTAGHDVKIAGRPGFVEDILRTGCVAVELEDGDAELTESAALAEFARLWRPAVVVSNAAAGIAVAREVEAKAVRVLGPEDAEATADHALDVVPPSLRENSSPGDPLRHVPYFGPVEVPTWLRRKARRTRILLSLTDPSWYEPVFAALSEVDAELVCAAELPAGLALPQKVKLVDSAPPAAVLPTCAAVVHDGDESLALAAVAYGLPQLSLTESAFGARVTAAGAGISGAVEGISRLTEETLRAGADALRAEVAALPAPRAVAAALAS
ncbi:nucleotide disphospho-sugar-binding domain-containing protein [Amycolatopsis orientalis]|uniref:nucleotide disphospho-sugar-binding domain-containing protein n=1 Tax=Amycolatopsis orientalis TaxID=31958 RepID=UPI0003A0C959|nr:nucleotide disphospho-sugar-binding domain-containing protein [Amycolatopsis orientalis]